MEPSGIELLPPASHADHQSSKTCFATVFADYLAE